MHGGDAYVFTLALFLFWLIIIEKFMFLLFLPFLSFFPLYSLNVAVLAFAVFVVKLQVNTSTIM